MDNKTRGKSKSRKKKTTTQGINRKIAHNAVESRRKLKISKLVEQLSSLVDPSCHCGKETKVDVLQKVVKRIQELEKMNEELKSPISVEHRLGNETQLQEQFTNIMSEHISLLIKYHCHQSTRDPVQQHQIKHVSNPQPSSNESRCGFGMADLLETCNLQPTPSSINRPLVGGRDQSQYLKQALWPGSNSDANIGSSNLPQMTTPNSTYPLSPWQQGTSNHLNGGESLWEHNHASFQLPAEVHHMDLPANSYYSEVVQPHPSQFMSHDDPNRTSVSSNVWRPYNDPSIGHSQQGCGLSNQMNSSFLVEQLLEKLL